MRFEHTAARTTKEHAETRPHTAHHNTTNTLRRASRAQQPFTHLCGVEECSGR